MPINNEVNIFILQHPTETGNPKGSAIIAKLYLQNSVSWIGEDFSHHSQLNQLITQQGVSTFVVYPAKSAINLDNLSPDSCGVDSAKPVNLIFIDASWRKAKKIWHLSENLQRLPCITLDPEHKSNYRIRKTPGDQYLSTIEAICYSLARLEQNPAKYQPLVDIFNRMINFQIMKMGEDTYRSNYQ